MIELVWQPQSLCFTVYVWGEILKFARLYVRFRYRTPCRSRRNPTARRRARALLVHSSNVRRPNTSAARRQSKMLAENPAHASTWSG